MPSPDQFPHSRTPTGATVAETDRASLFEKVLFDKPDALLLLSRARLVINKVTFQDGETDNSLHRYAVTHFGNDGENFGACFDGKGRCLVGYRLPAEGLRLLERSGAAERVGALLYNDAVSRIDSILKNSFANRSCPKGAAAEANTVGCRASAAFGLGASGFRSFELASCNWKEIKPVPLRPHPDRPSTKSDSVYVRRAFVSGLSLWAERVANATEQPFEMLAYRRFSELAIGHTLLRSVGNEGLSTDFLEKFDTKDRQMAAGTLSYLAKNFLPERCFRLRTALECNEIDPSNHSFVLEAFTLGVREFKAQLSTDLLSSMLERSDFEALVPLIARTVGDLLSHDGSRNPESSIICDSVVRGVRNSLRELAKEHPPLAKQSTKRFEKLLLAIAQEYDDGWDPQAVVKLLRTPHRNLTNELARVFELSEYYAGSGNGDLAQELISDFLRRNPNECRSGPEQVRLAFVWVLAGGDVAAFEALGGTVSKVSTWEWAYFQAIQHQVAKRFDREASSLEEALAGGDKEPRLSSLLVQNYLNRGLKRKALRVAESVLAFDLLQGAELMEMVSVAKDKKS